MDLLQGKIRTLYFRYLTAAFGSALISSVYGIVDMAMVGQYQGPDGTAALAVVAPVWNIIYSLGLLTGIGGCVLYSMVKGKNRISREDENEYFTSAVISTVFFAVLCWLALIRYDTQMLSLFGADATLLPLAKQYLLPVKLTVPFFLFNQMLAAFLRNDSHPGLATKAVLAGGIFNIAGDYFFVFTLDMGILGAGIATALGAVISFLIMVTHFSSRINTLRLVLPRHPGTQIRNILTTGFSTFFIDIAMGILTMLFNRQIMKYLGTSALAVYGIIVNISTFVQCCAYSVGQAAQPIISMNYGAGQWARIRKTLECAIAATACFSLFWTALTYAVPNRFVRLFMNPTQEVLSIAPAIIRCYGLSFLLLPLNIFSTYYFQSLMKPKAAFLVSVSRGVLVSGLLITMLPSAAGPDALWLAMPVTELAVATGVIYLMKRYTRGL